jgi:hypothetical protein
MIGALPSEAATLGDARLTAVHTIPIASADAMQTTVAVATTCETPSYCDPINVVLGYFYVDSEGQPHYDYVGQSTVSHGATAVTLTYPAYAQSMEIHVSQHRCDVTRGYILPQRECYTAWTQSQQVPPRL